MAGQLPSRRQQAAALAVLLWRLGRSPELTRLLLLLLVWGHIRSRPGYTTIDPGSGPKLSPQGHVPKGKGFHIRRPRERFL